MLRDGGHPKATGVVEPEARPARQPEGRLIDRYFFRGGATLEVDDQHACRAGHYAHRSSPRVARWSGCDVRPGQALWATCEVDEVVTHPRLHRRVLPTG